MSTVNDWRNEFFELNPDTSGECYGENNSQKVHKLDLFKTVLPAIDRRDKTFYSKLTTEEQDSIEPWLLMVWLASSESEIDQKYYIEQLNSLVNKNFSNFSAKKTQGISGHKELQWMLLSMCGRHKFTRRKFIAPAKGKIKNKLESALLELNPSLKDDELELMQKINTKEELITYLKENAIDDKTIKDILKGF